MTRPKPERAELRAGDVVVYGPGDVRVVHHVELTPTNRFARVHWADGRSSVCERERAWTKLVAGPEPRRAQQQAAPPPTPPTSTPSSEESP